MEYKEINKKSDVELQKFLLDEEKGLTQMRLKIATGQLKNVRAVRVARRTIARVKFLLNKRSSS